MVPVRGRRAASHLFQIKGVSAALSIQNSTSEETSEASSETHPQVVQVDNLNISDNGVDYMSEPLRIHSANILFHVFNRGNAKQKIFLDDEDYSFYLWLLRKYKMKYGIRLYHFVLMPNHFHLLIEPTKVRALSFCMQSITATYSLNFNRKYHSVGHVWQSRFRSIPIETDSYYLRCARYIELNPVRSHLVEHPESYRWSSYLRSIQKKPIIWIDEHPLLRELNKTRMNYQEFVGDQIIQAKNGNSERFSSMPIYGDNHFMPRYLRGNL